jgi:hypothetical protein
MAIPYYICLPAAVEELTSHFLFKSFVWTPELVIFALLLYLGAADDDVQLI